MYYVFIMAGLICIAYTILANTFLLFKVHCKNIYTISALYQIIKCKYVVVKPLNIKWDQIRGNTILG